MSQFQQPRQQMQPPSSPVPPYVPPENALCRREILGPYHAVELYQDGALWILDQEDPPIELKLDAQAAQRLRDFLIRPDGQHYKATAAHPHQQPKNAAPAKQPIKRDNGDAVFWLLIFWPVGLYMLWKYASWPDVVKTIITLLLIGLTLLWWVHIFA